MEGLMKRKGPTCAVRPSKFGLKYLAKIFKGRQKKNGKVDLDAKMYIVAGNLLRHDS
jgi:hypothetical protein